YDFNDELITVNRYLSIPRIKVFIWDVCIVPCVIKQCLPERLRGEAPVKRFLKVYFGYS
ncbi:unnamed protein product, partial [marine sediment metagenome]